MKIIEEENNPLLSLKRITCEIDSKVTPQKPEVKKILAEHFKINEDLVVVKHVYSTRGANKTKIIAQIYDSVERLKSVEGIKKTKKKKEEHGKKNEAKE